MANHRVALLTLPLGANFGGIIQAYALSEFLKSQGCFVEVLNKRYRRGYLSSVAVFILERLPGQNVKGFREGYIKALHNAPFLKKHLNLSPKLNNRSQVVERLNINSIDTMVVGSDQVWRRSYVDDAYMDLYYLNIPECPGIRKIAYAASYGGGQFDAGPLESVIGDLLKGFDSLSVREMGAREELLEKFGDIEIGHVCDPTLLHDKSFYQNIMSREPSNSKDGGLAYILDLTPEKQMILDLAEESTNLPCFTLTGKAQKKFDLTNWLREFNDADYVVTDSFHGVVFSIIFQKPFVAIGNPDRGMERFNSLLQQLNLSDRLFGQDEVVDYSLLSMNFSQDCSRIIQEFSARSQQFLLSSLK